MASIEVLLSTYNGSQFLRTQIESVLSQRNVDLSLLIRDDGSSDDTQSIINEYQENNENVEWYQGKNIGPCKSFFDLLKNSGNSDFFAFCDQDDYWEPDKLKVAINKLSAVDSKIPALYCSNLKVVDQNLNMCRMAHSSSFNLENRYLALVDFFAVGCTMVFNKAARDMIVAHITEDCLMHDSWAFQVCNFFGKVIYDPDSYIMYRQHNNNVVGAKLNAWEALKDSISRVFDKSQQPRWRNAKALMKEFAQDFSDADLMKVKKMADYKNGFFQRVKLLFDFKIRGYNFRRDIRYRFLILIGRI